MLPED